MSADTHLPEVVSPEEWLTARKDLLVKEKEATRARDRVNADRRRLPMVRIDEPIDRADGWDLVAGVPLHRPRSVPPYVPDITARFLEGAFTSLKIRMHSSIFSGFTWMVTTRASIVLILLLLLLPSR